MLLIHGMFLALPNDTIVTAAAPQSNHLPRAATINRGIFQNVPIWSATVSTDFTCAEISNQNAASIIEGVHFLFQDHFNNLVNKNFTTQLLLPSNDRSSVLN